MLSRVLGSQVLFNSSRGHLTYCFVRATSSVKPVTPTDLAAVKEKYLALLKEELPKPYEGPERDYVNFPRRKTADLPGKVRFGFLPDEWFQFFYKKTGVTGPYIFGFGLLTFLLSKELYVIENELSTGVALFILYYIAYKKYGAKISAFGVKMLDEESARFENSKSKAMKNLEDSIAMEKKKQFQIEAQKYILDAKRENVLMQLEAEYRKRLMTVYEAVKKRLDFHQDLYNEKRKFEQKYMVNWIVENVIKSITPQQEKDTLKKCIEDLKLLATRAN